ncbi:hypothetical protein LJR009_005845 [Bosea sp. LjRoot9]|uniref:hypothetical protein n=1 Tax=Bosea sp. LjRoot9 TaxID=3342341 RepID=UPI003ECE25DD
MLRPRSRIKDLRAVAVSPEPTGTIACEPKRSRHPEAAHLKQMRDAIFSFHSPCQQHRHCAAELFDFPQAAEINRIIR